MKTTVIPPGTLLAEAVTIATAYGTCAICQDSIHPGDKVARLTVMTRGWVHVSCTSRIRKNGGQ
jgi:hypothetical protein